VEIFKPRGTIDFMKHRTRAAVFSSVLMIATVVSLFVPGPNLGVDFAGGTEIEVQLRAAVSASELRQTVIDLGHDGPEIVSVQGQANRYVLRVKDDATRADKRAQVIRKKLEGGIGEAKVQGVKISGGGDRIALTMSQAVAPADIENAVEGAGIEVRSVSEIGSSGELRYQVQLVGAGDELVAGLQKKLGERGPEGALRVEWVGPKAGAQLRDAAIKSMLYAMALIMVYVAFRFDLRFAPGGIIALFHDAMIVILAYVITQREMTLGTVAAVLTVIGYSINDTIVIFDRIRENMARARDARLADVINESLTQTLSRTLITSSVTMLSILGFFIWGTPVVKDIAFALMVGFVSGTYSTIYIATPAVEWIDRRFFSRPIA
jgi:preprotein translocase subunit SecF